MRRVFWLTLIFAAMSCAGQSNTPPLTIEQCRADYKLWTAPNLTLSKKEWSVEVLNTRAKEMLFCEMDHRDAPERPEWIGLENQLIGSIQTRYMHFLERHHLWNTFLDEDEKGER